MITNSLPLRYAISLLTLVSFLVTGGLNAAG